MISLIHLLTATIVGLQFADYYTTWVILKRGGDELNPVVRGLMRRFGTAWGLLIAKFWAGAVVATGACIGWFDSSTGVIGLLLLTIFYFMVIINNYFTLRGMP